MTHILLEPGDPLLPTDEFLTNTTQPLVWKKVWVEFETCRPSDVIRRASTPIAKPQPTWRKISDGPVTYPCWFANGSDDVGEGYLAASGNRHCIGKSSVWEAGITHWMPRDPAPQPPAPASDEELAYFNWCKKFGRDGPIDADPSREAWLAALEFAKGQR